MNFIKTILLFFVAILFSNQTYSQNTLDITTSFDGGVGINSFTKNREVLTGRFSGNFNGNIGLLFTLRDRYTIEAGIGQGTQHFNMKSVAFENRNSGFLAEVKIKNYYPTYYIGLGYVRPITDRIYTYGKTTFAYNEIQPSSKTESINYGKLNERITATTNFVGSNFTLAPEFGMQLKTYTGFKFHAGIKFNLGLGEILNGTYKVDSLIETTVNNVTTASRVDIQDDSYSSNGTWFGINIGASYTLFASVKKEEKIIEEIVVAIQPEVETTKPVEDTATKKVEVPETIPTKPDNIYLPVKLEERPLKTTRKYKVHSNKIRIELFDGAVEDGDTISVLLNGKVILHRYGLLKKHLSFDMYIEEGKNVFSIFAHNLGRIKPNTARVYIWEGKRKHIMTVRSTLGESGAVEIDYIPENKIEEEKE